MIIKSVFKNMEKIPIRYTADGDDINPPMEIIDAPQKTKSLVLIIDDPDAPNRTWVHWVVFNIPPAIKKIEENSVPRGSVLGLNDMKILKYHGPAPPSGTHRYFFKLYSLDIVLNLLEGVKKEDIEKAMSGHILAKAELIGVYFR
jgi:Raf kinase inhibitor-like YbhB/YbcL family protein